MTIHHKRNSLDAILAEANRLGSTEEVNWLLSNKWADSYVYYQDTNPRSISLEPQGSYIDRCREYANKETREYMKTILGGENKQ
jgi:hypothetical protein